MEKQFRILKITDSELTKIFDKLFDDASMYEPIVQTNVIIGGIETTPQIILDKITDSYQFEKIKKQVRTKSKPSVSIEISVVKDDLFQKFILKILPHNGAQVESTQLVNEYLYIVTEVDKYFKEASSSDLYKEVDLKTSQIFHAREVEIEKLSSSFLSMFKKSEELHQKILNDSFIYEHKVKEENKELEQRLLDVYKQKEQNILEFKEKLDQREAALDTRDNEQTRRDIYKEVIKELKKRSDNFELSKSTQNKRWPVHGAFAVLIGAIGFLLGFFLYHFKSGDLESIFKITTSSIGLAAAIVFYIRWNDSWFRKHADEEFTMKKLELDISRASWIVEMIMEFQKENNSAPIPEYLVKILANNLFEDKSIDRAKHPYEEILGKVAKNLKSLNLNIPGVGSLGTSDSSSKPNS